MINMTSKNSRLDEISTLHTTTWLMLENQNKLNFAGSAGEIMELQPPSHKCNSFSDKFWMVRNNQETQN